MGLGVVVGSLLWALAPAGTPSYAEVAAKGPQAILEASDEVHYGYKDQAYSVRLVLHEKDGTTRERGMAVAQKSGMRLVRFTSPADVKGVAVLVMNSETMYVYMPSLNKVRLVASHTRKQTFMGSDYTYDEMAITRFSIDYTAALSSETDKDVVLDLTQRPGRDLAYPRLRVEIEKKSLLCHTIRYMDSGGKEVKREERSTVDMSEGCPIFTHLIMRDLGSGHWTEMYIIEHKTNAGLDDSFFSKRNLVRGE
jgi:outer membrane lipoprotein-sorting protein